MSESETPKKAPHEALGAYLRKVRQKKQQTVAEVSGAVEIDSVRLERIEAGLELPGEDILLLLISYLGIDPDDAANVWQMAGYDEEAQKPSRGRMQEDLPQNTTKQPLLMMLALDTRVVYTNGVEVTADKSGVVMSFSQTAESSQPRTPVARVGMSHDQAEHVLEVLQRALLHDKYGRGPKALPAPKTVNSSKLKKKNDQHPKKESKS